MSEFIFYPQSVIWEITFACNMRCLHCGTSAGKPRPKELTSQEAFNLIDELASLKCESITLSGGEPLLRKDWKQLAKRVKHHGIALFLISNGYLMDETVVEDIINLRFDNVGISFDGSRNTHDYIRQCHGSHDRVINAMRLLHKAGSPFCAVSQISNLNLEELDQIRQELIDNGCELWRIQMTTATGRMRSELTLTLDNYPKLIDKILEFREDNTIKIDVGENIGYYGCKGTKLWDNVPYLGCYAGTRILGIESDGKIKGCLSMPERFVEGSIRDSSLTEIWNRPDAFEYNRKFTRSTATGECHDCRYLPLCRGGCTTTSVSASGQRANNPYCIYRMEKKQGIEPADNEVILMLLKRFEEPVKNLEEACR